MRSPRATLVVAMVVLLTTAGCRAANVTPERPVTIPEGLVPQAVGGDRFTFVANKDAATKEAFADAGPSSLVSDGKVWELRDGEDLAGTLQISAVKASLDLRDPEKRKSIVEGLMPGTYDRVRLGGLVVYSNRSRNKIVYMWFGRQVYVVLQMKNSEFDPAPVMKEIVTEQTQADSWVHLTESDDNDKF